MDTDKLIKILNMTSSSHDGEALAALRTAIKLMAAAKVTWADIIKVSTKPMSHVNDATAYKQSADVAHAEMFSKIYEQMRKEQERSRAKRGMHLYDEYSDSVFEAIFGKKKGR